MTSYCRHLTSYKTLSILARCCKPSTSTSIWCWCTPIRVLSQIEEIIPWAEEITVPIEYTGYVSQRPSGRSPGRDEIQWHSVDDRRMTIVSAGGDGRTGLTVCAYSAWNRILSQSAVADRTLAVFLPLFPGPEELALLERPVGRHSIRLLSFTPHFMDWMQAADLSISQAGYNTCTNLLQTRTRAILVPNPQMPDQLRRARLIAERGLAVTIDPADLTPERLADAMLDQFQAPPPQHDINLDGARTTRTILERLLTGGCGSEAAVLHGVDN